MAPQTARKQQRQQRAISFSLELLRVRGLPECDALFYRQPVSQSHPEISDTLDAPYSSSEIRTQQTGISCLIGQAPHGPKTKIDCSGRQQASFKITAIAQNHGPV